MGVLLFVLLGNEGRSSPEVLCLVVVKCEQQTPWFLRRRRKIPGGATHIMRQQMILLGEKV